RAISQVRRRRKKSMARVPRRVDVANAPTATVPARAQASARDTRVCHDVAGCASQAPLVAMRTAIRHESAGAFAVAFVLHKRFALVATALALVLAAASAALAQVNPYRVQQRYKEASKGKRSEEHTSE